ncbi:helix-turn-helix transcriptional regulator [Lentzea sp. NPDC042327]|uniref:helix-turn-helix domain-containing protein n=1 Tax=Lentzea sp. NPDC042327 TaxID=3154801 RepID=UPI0033D14A5E
MTYSTAYSRDLGDELRLIRETSTSLHGRAMANRLGWDPSKVSTIEHGKAHASAGDIIQYLTVCGKDLEYIEAFQARYRHAFDPYFAQMPENLRTLMMAESLATKITWVETSTAPGLVQTAEYADALYRKAGLVALEKIAACVQCRIDRQTILRRARRPEIRIYVLERALQTYVGDDKIMEEQYLRMLFNTHIVRIIPEDAVILTAGCALLEFEKAPPVAYTDSELAQVFAQDDAAIEVAVALFKRLETFALDQEQSKRKLMEYISRLRGDSNGAGTDLA